MSEIQAKMMDLHAAADYLGTGAVEVPMFEQEILDRVRRGSRVLQRIPAIPATGHPHRYFEQLAIATAGAVDPRNISAVVTGPTRVERPAFIKAVTAQSNISLFDKEVTEQQGQFASVVAKDLDDVIKAVTVKRSQMLWTGTDTSLSAPTTLEWMGVLPQLAVSPFNQIVAVGVSIIDTLKSVVAALMGQVGFDVMPSSIAMNPVLGDYIDREAKASHIELGTEQITAGVTVQALSTQAGKLPMIPEPYLLADVAAKYGFAAPAAGLKNYYAVILMEEMIERPVISGKEFNPNPRVFQLGLTQNLNGQFLAVAFDTLIVKGATYSAAIVCVQRP